MKGHRYGSWFGLAGWNIWSCSFNSYIIQYKLLRYKINLYQLQELKVRITLGAMEDSHL
jgi:hypothetical protein